MNVVTDTASYHFGPAEYDLYVAMPEARSGKLPGIFVGPAWDGLNAPIEETTRRVAALGYVAVAVDVYGKGVRGDIGADNSALMEPLVADRLELRGRLQAGYAAMAALPEVDADRLGAIGYCFGGLCVLDLARINVPQLCGVVSFHGVLGATTAESDAPIQASVLIEHGWADPVAPPDDYLAFCAEMDARQADWQAHVHGGAVHAFTFAGANSPETGVAYDEAADRRSWLSMVNFFDELFD